MKAMILAAGLGSRLKPLTNNIPKALVEVGGVPMLEKVILSLKHKGFKRFVVNVHHFSNQIIDFLSTRDYGVEIQISDETEELLDTGGGIAKAYDLLFSKDSRPVLIHNVDIISNADLKGLISQSSLGSSLLTSDRESSRKLLFDLENNLSGWHNLKENIYRWVNNKEFDKELAFSGIYMMGKSAVEEMRSLHGIKKYSVMDYFLNQNRKLEVKGFEQTDLELIDIGKPATLLQASEIFNKNSKDISN